MSWTVALLSRDHAGCNCVFATLYLFKTAQHVEDAHNLATLFV